MEPFHDSKTIFLQELLGKKMNFLKSSRWYFLLLVSLWALFCYLRIGITHGPFQGMGDYAGWEYSGYYLYENLALSPFPTLSFTNNIHFYPSGISPIFMSWGLERDYFYALCLTLFGQGPWLPLYYALSCLCLTLGVFFLSASRLGKTPAMLLSIFVTFFNAYATHKFPGHFGVAVHHWTSLSLLTDYFILTSILAKTVPSLRLISFRVLCTIGALGLELGYIGGISLTSGVLLILATLIFFFLFYLKHKALPFSLSQILSSWHQEAKIHWKSLSSTLSITAFYSFWILPLLLCIMAEVRVQQTPDLVTSGWHASPLRLIIPTILPIYESLTALLKDNPEGYFAGSTGLSVLIFSAIGAFCAIRAKRYEAIYLLVFFFLLVTFKPTGRSLLAFFPWHTYARVTPRMTMFYPMLLGLLIMGFPWWQSFCQSSKIKKWIFALLCLLFAAETPMFFSNHIKSPALETVSKEFTDYMERIKAAKGEAVLDFPFCYSGGNGGGFCPGDLVQAVWANRKFHGKKVLGTNFGRLLHKYSQFYKPYGLHQLLEVQQTRCLEEKELLYLKSFFEAYDFCCMNLYADLIPKGCAESYFKILGTPDDSARLDGFGKAYLFYRKGPTISQEEGMSWPLFRLIETISDLKTLHPFELIQTDSGTQKALEAFHKWLQIPVTSDSSPTDQPILILKRREKNTPDISQAELIFQRDDVQIYYKDPLSKKQAQTQIDLFPLMKQQLISGALDVKYDDKASSIFIHPNHNAIARLTLNNISIQNLQESQNSYLSFKIKLDNDQGDVIFRVFANEKKLFEHHMKSQMTSLAIRIPLDSLGKTPINLHFEIDPNGSCDYDWTYFLEPKIVSIN